MCSSPLSAHSLGEEGPLGVPGVGGSGAGMLKRVQPPPGREKDTVPTSPAVPGVGVGRPLEGSGGGTGGKNEGGTPEGDRREETGACGALW